MSESPVGDRNDLQDLKDRLAVLKACKTSEEAERAGVLMGQEEMHKRWWNRESAS